MNGEGCWKCKESKGEKIIGKFLINNHIKYERQYKFNNCRNIIPLSFDFYLSNYNTCVEFDGIQHFKSIEYWGGIKNLNYIKKCDKIKNDYCKNNNIKLIRIRYNENIIDKLKNIFA